MSLGKKMKIARGDLKIIPLYEKWLHEGSRKLDVHHEILGKIIDRPERIRTKTFSASGAGQCLRRRQLSYLGYEQAKPDDKTMNIFVNGDFVHLRHQIAGIQMGYFLDAEVSTAMPKYNLSGTMDAVMDDQGIGEIKSINANGFRTIASYGPKDEHDAQVHSYMLCSGRESARILYENKDTNELKEFLVERNPHTIQKVEDDLKILNEATNDEVLVPPLASSVTMTGECRWCPFQKVCHGARFASQAESKPAPVKLSIRKSS